MAVDIGPRIGIDGEKEFRKQLQNINQQLRTLGSEMKAVTSAFDDGDRSEEALAAQTGVLNRQIDAQRQKLSQLQQGLDAAADKFGETDTRTLKWRQAVNEATATLNKMESQLKSSTDEVDDLGEAASDAGGRLDAFSVTLGNLASSAIQAAVSAVADLVSSLWNLDEATEDFRKAQGRVNTAFESAGYGPEAAEQAYREFYKILGDTDTAAEASQLLAKLADDEADLATWTEIAAGVSGTFGDSLPIEGLIEASNETAKVGQVTGVLADALNWAGISEDEFNAKLEACRTESERNDLIMSTLSETYDEAADAFHRNSAGLERSRDATFSMNSAAADLGAVISQVKTEVLTELTPALTDLSAAFGAVLQGDPQGGQAMADAIQGLIQTVSGMLPEVLDAGVQIVGALASGILQSLPTLAQSVVDLVPQVVEVLRDSSEALLSAGTDLLLQLTDGIVQAIPELIEAIPQIISDFVDFIEENLPQIAHAGGEMLGKLVAGLLGGIPDLMDSLPEIVAAIVNGLLDLQGSILEAGADIVRGLVDGIVSMGAWLKEQITEFCSNVLNGFLDFFGIRSPSTVMRDEVGEMLGQGVAEGLDDSVTYVEQAADRIGQAVSDKILETQEALEQEQEDLVKESLDAQLEALEEFSDAYEDALEDLRSRQQSMADKLSDYGDLFSWVETNSADVLELGDLQEQIDAINDYSAALEALKARGASESLMEEIVGLNIDDATAYTNKLLEMTDDEYSSYMQLWEEKQRAAANIARSFYADELRGLEEEFVDQLPEALSSLKGELEQLGSNCALGLADGFRSEAQAIEAAFVSTTENALTAAEQAMGVHSPSTVWAGFGRNLALGLDNGFTSAMEAVSARMTRAIPTPTVDSINNAVAQGVNGISAINSGVQFPREIVLTLENGQEIARWLLPYSRAAARANPEVGTA